MAESQQFQTGVVSSDPEHDARILVFDSGFSLCLTPEGSIWHPSSLEGACASIIVGRLGSCDIHTLRKSQTDDQAVSLRSLLGELSVGELAAVGAAKQRLHWLEDNRFCGRCGGLTGWHEREYALYCAACDHRYYPRLSPCVIVAVRRGRELLLGHSHRHPPGLWTLIAGFIEPGESAEQAVRREVMEETGVTLGRVEYRESESWPFPHQLMLGFVADYEAGELCRQEDELAALDWFSAQDLPWVPGKWTIAGRLIRAVAQENGVTP